MGSKRTAEESVYECRLCNLVANCTATENEEEHLSIVDTLLWQNDNFVLTPGLGALLPGYVLLTTKEHLPSCCHVTADMISRLDQAISFVLSVFNTEFGPACAFEHGTLRLEPDDRTCLNHLHVHTLPHYSEIDTKLRQLSKPVQLETLTELERVVCEFGNDYVWTKTADDDYRVFIFDDLPSQLVRQLYADVLNIEDWDWREYPYWENIEITVERFKHLLS